MQTEWLVTFVEIAKRGSFTAAATTLGYTQSAASRHIAALEADCGARLFERRPGGAVLTAEGSVLLDHAEAILRRLADARTDVAVLSGVAARRLRVGAFPTALAALVPSALKRLREAHPEADMSLVEGHTPQLVEALLRNEIDVAVLSDIPDADADYPGLRRYRLLDEPMLVAVPASHRLARRRVVRLVELSEDPFVVGSATAEASLLRARLPPDFRPKVDIVAADWTAKLGCVAAGLGVCLIPMLAARSIASDVRLLRLHPADSPARRVFAASREERALGPLVSEFLANLHDGARLLNQDGGGRASMPQTSAYGDR